MAEGDTGKNGVDIDLGKIDTLITSLFKVDGLKFGKFALKSGIISPVYFDLRVVISHPKILKSLSDLVGAEVSVRKQAGNLDLICGIPYTALPIASLVCVAEDVPMLIKRKEQKSYGTGKLIEGSYIPKQRVLLIEDVVTSGSSVVDTAESLRAAGLVVDEALIILDRGQGASYNLTRNGISFKALITMDRMLTVLLKEGLITSAQKEEVTSFIANNQLFDPALDKILTTRIIPRIRCDAGVKLVKIMMKKSTNLCLSVDLDRWEDVLTAVEMLGSKICLVKTHIDTMGLKGGRIIAEFWGKLKELSVKHDFLIMEDRKFGDIGSTTRTQLKSKPFEICKWADFVTIHGISGPGILNAIQQADFSIARNKTPLAGVLIAEMSSEMNIPSQLPGYKQQIYEMAEYQFPSIVGGFVSQSRPPRFEKNDPYAPYFLQFTPGVALTSAAKGDGLGQVYNSVEAVVSRGADVIIVGRGIIGESKSQWVEVAEKFRVQGWAAFKARMVKE